MQTINTAFERLLKQIVEEEIEKFKERLATGMLPTYDDYRFETGRITGMRLVLGYFDEINKKLSEN